MLAWVLVACREPPGGECRDGAATVDVPDASSDTGRPTGSTGETGTVVPSWVELDGGFHVGCGLVDTGLLLCWGDEAYLDHSAGPFVDFDLDVWGGCGITPDGHLDCWCDNRSESTQPACDDVPVRGGFVRVTHATYWGCAEDRQHVVQCWGRHNLIRDTPREPVLHWDSESNYACAVLADESVTCWGHTQVFALGGPGATLAPPTGFRYRKVSAGRDHACALDVDGEAHCWGSTQVETPWPYPNGTPGPWVDLVSSNAFTCGIRADGSAECWHDSLNGILDDWDLPDERWAQIGLGEWTGCGLTLDGRGICFDEDYGNSGEFDVPDLASLPE